MRDGEQRDALFADEIKNEADDFASGFGVEISGGFVGEEDAGPVCQGAGDGDALLFAAAEFGGQMICAVGEADLREQFGGVRVIRTSTDHAGQENVFECGEFGEEGVALENEAHACVAQLRLASR